MPEDASIPPLPRRAPGDSGRSRAAPVAPAALPKSVVQRILATLDAEETRALLADQAITSEPPAPDAYGSYRAASHPAPARAGREHLVSAVRAGTTSGAFGGRDRGQAGQRRTLSVGHDPVGWPSVVRPAANPGRPGAR